ncbi:hypothetical protein PT2222_130245 [Paraburkholderia tropica]
MTPMDCPPGITFKSGRTCTFVFLIGNPARSYTNSDWPDFLPVTLISCGSFSTVNASDDFSWAFTDKLVSMACVWVSNTLICVGISKYSFNGLHKPTLNNETRRIKPIAFLMLSGIHYFTLLAPTPHLLYELLLHHYFCLLSPYL